MSSDALAVVREFCELLSAKDQTGVMEMLDPDVVWYGTRGGLDENQVLRGPQAVLDYWAEIEDPWQQWDVEVERLIDAGDAVVVYWREAGRARHADLEVRSETALIIRVRDRKILEATGYLDRTAALEAAGLAD